MQTLSYGFKRPQTGDSGGLFWPALEDVITQTNSHDHNGINSAPLATGAVVSTTQAISSSNWVATSGGTYRQTITMPTGLVYGQCFINFLITSSGNQVYPQVDKVSSNSYYVYTNDNSLDYTAVYVS